MKKKFGLIFSVFLFSVLMVPLMVFANDTDKFYDDFDEIVAGVGEVNYQFNVKETFNYLYDVNYSLDDLISNYIKSKSYEEYDVSLTFDKLLNKGNYKISYKDKEYTSSFTYMLVSELEINSSSDNYLEEISNYVKNNTEFTTSKVEDLGDNQYKITINDISHDFLVRFIKPQQSSEVSIKYQAHVESIGWQDVVSSGIIGTTGMGKQMEALKIEGNFNGLEGSIVYRAHVESIGWQDAVSNGMMAGTEGKGKQMEALTIKLTGDVANYYDIYYRTHVETYGYFDWAKNGEISGSVGYGKQIEALEIKLVKKGEDPSLKTGNINKVKDISVLYSAHVSSIGWQDAVSNGLVAGTVGRGLQVEALKIRLNNTYGYSGDITYSAHVSSIGWQNEVSNGMIAGTTGRGLQIEAIKINLTGELADHYDIYYTTHVKNSGWLGYAKNGEIAGTIGFGRRLEALRIVLVPKGSNPPGSLDNASIVKASEIIYQAHVSSIGWQNEVKNGALMGTTGRGLAIEGVKLSLSSTIKGNVNYETYVRYKGWQNEVSNGSVSGSVGEARHIEGIKIRLTGDIASYYDVYYRVHVSSVGWLDWALNGAKAGSDGMDKAIEGIEVKLVVKDSAFNEPVSKPYVNGTFKVVDGKTYYYDYLGNMANDWAFIDGVKYFFNSKGVMIGKNVRKVIDVSSHQKDIDWKAVSTTDVDAVIIRVAAGSDTEDSYLLKNVEGASSISMPYGLYIYSYAEDKAVNTVKFGLIHEAALEAERIVESIEKYKMNLTLPIYYDLEKWDISDGNHNWGPSDYLNIVSQFRDRLNMHGYDFKIYTSKNFADTALVDWKDKIDWIAQFNHYCDYSGNYTKWQYSSTEKVLGINGNVDVSVWF